MTSSPISAVSPITTPIPWSMKNRRPMVAPGWISMPVSERVTCVSTRANPRQPGLAHSRCAMRYDQIACRPEYTKAFSRSPRAAGSCVRAFCRSSRRVDRTVIARLLPDVIEECCRDVPFAEGADDRHDEFSCILRSLREFERGPHVGARRDAAEDALVGAKVPSDGDGIVEGDVDDLVIDCPVEDLGNEVGPDALDLVWSRIAAVEDRGIDRLDGADLHPRPSPLWPRPPPG